MIKKLLMASLYIMMNTIVYAQTIDMQSLLHQVEQNNGELKTYKPYKESQIASMKALNVLDDPEVSTYFLPFGEANSKNYWEMEISQSFKLPKVYKAQNEIIENEAKLIDYQYEEKRQEVLLEASLLILQIIAANKQEIIEEERLKQSLLLFEQNQSLFNQGELGILDYNKSKVAHMRLRFKIDQLNSTRQEALLSLKNLNGGHSIDIPWLDYQSDIAIPNQEVLWSEFLTESKVLQRHKYAETIAEDKARYVGLENLPKFKLGYGVQGLLKENNHGFSLGASFPFWSKKSRKKAAESQVVYQQSITNAQRFNIERQYKSDYQQYNVLQSKYEEYRSTIEGLQSEGLLRKAYMAGEMSYSEYFIELEFYHDAHDALLQMEKQLQLLKSKLLRHKI